MTSFYGNGKESEIKVTSPSIMMDQYLKHHFDTLLCGTNISTARILLDWPYSTLRTHAQKSVLYHLKTASGTLKHRSLHKI